MLVPEYIGRHRLPTLAMASHQKIRVAMKGRTVRSWLFPKLFTPKLSPVRSPCHEKILSIWGLFFKSYGWLEKVCKAGNPPVLIGSVLNHISQDSVDPKQRGHLTLICEGNTYPALFKECLQPHAMHTHGKVMQPDYAFKDHRITLNAHCVMTGSAANSIYTRWPELLSEVSAIGRQSAFLVWGETTVRQTQTVAGLGRNLKSAESVSRICTITLQDYMGNRPFQICRENSLLFEYDYSQSCYKYAKNYERIHKNYKDIIENREDIICEGCGMK